MELEPELREPVRRGQAGGILGLTSVVLLAGSVRWAHHWGPMADTIVSAWALAASGAFVVSVWALRTSRASRKFAKIGIALTLLSLVALTVDGALYALGVDAAGACGGG